MKRTAAIVFLIVIICVLFVACGPEPVKKYDVKVPQLSGATSRSSRQIVASEDVLSDMELVSEFFAYRIAPPIIGFSRQSIEEGSEITAGLSNLSCITLSMSLDSAGDYVFEGSNGDDYIYVKVSKDNSSFDYVHAVKIYGSAGGTGDEFDIVLGQGIINEDNSFEGCGILYYLLEGNEGRRMKFVFHNNGDDRLASPNALVSTIRIQNEEDEG